MVEITGLTFKRPMLASAGIVFRLEPDFSMRVVGEDLYITSAEEEDAGKFPESTKFQGAAFKVHVGVKGEKLHGFRRE